MPEPQIMVVEDDPKLRSLVARGLREEGFEVTVAANGGEAMREADRAVPDALIIDIGLPDADGRDLCQALRARGLQAPVLFLTARDAVQDRLAGFRAGGDDYVTKPFHLDELTARMRALIKRAGTPPTAQYGELRLDPRTHEAIVGDHHASLTPIEFRLIAALANQGGTIASRLELKRAGWPDGTLVHDNTLDVYVARLRRKLGGLREAPRLITVHGVGYRLQD